MCSDSRPSEYCGKAEATGAEQRRPLDQKLAEQSSLLGDSSKAKELRHGMQEGLMLLTDFVLSKKVSARDLFDERLKKVGIREHVASGDDDERSRCLTDGREFLAVFLTEDGFVDFLTAYGVDAPRKILRAICETFGTEICSEHAINIDVGGTDDARAS